VAWFSCDKAVQSNFSFWSSGSDWFTGSSVAWIGQASETHLRNARPLPLVLAAVLINLTLVVRSIRWQALLAPIAKVSLNNLIAATAVGFGGLFVIGRAAEIIRPTVLSFA
jgi:hypothetical protein